MMKIVCALAFASAFAASAVHAGSLSEDYIATRTVSVRDIDFTDAQQVGQAYDRLKEASKEVCDTKEPGPAFRFADDRACEREAVRGAVRDLNQPLLTEMDSRTELAGAQPTRTHAARRETR